MQPAAAASPAPVGTAAFLRQDFARPEPRAATGGDLAAAAQNGGVSISAGLAGSQISPAIAIDPSNSQYLVASSDNLGSATVEAYYSADGGQTWGHAALPLTDPGGTTGQVASESSIASDSQGRFYLAYGLVDASTDTSDLMIAESTNHGQGWSTVAYTGGIKGGFADLRPAVAVDNWSFGPNQGDVYVAYTHFAGNQAHVMLTLSADHGKDWTSPVQVDAPGETVAENPAITVIPNGNVFVAWDDPIKGFVYGAECTVAGSTATCPVADQVVAADDSLSPAGPGATYSSLCTTGACYGIPPQPNRGISPDISVASYGTSTGGWALYLACTVPTGGPGTRILVAEARDGLAFTLDVAQLTEQTRMDYSFFPHLAVDPTTGEVWLSYYSTQNDGLLHEFANVYVTHWGGSGSTADEWAPPQQVNTTPLDEGVNGRQTDVFNNYGDSMGLAADGGVAHAVWTDPSDALAAGAKIVTRAVPLSVPLQVTDGLMGPAANQVGWPAMAGASIQMYARAGTTVSTSVYEATYTTPQALPGDHAYTATATTVDGVTAPSAVVTFNPNLAAPPTPTVTTTATTATVSWSPVPGAATYDLFIGGQGFYSAGGVTVSEATYLAAFNVPYTSVLVSGLEPGASYQFGVAAVDAAGVPGRASAVRSASTQPGAAAPSGVAAQALSPNAVAVYWAWLPLNGLTYSLYRSKQVDSGFAEIDTGLTSAQVLDEKGLSPNTTYYYYVTAVTSAGTSVKSRVVHATTPSAAPGPAATLVTAVPVSPYAITVSWTPPAGFTGTYQVWGAINPHSFYDLIASGLTATTYTETGLQPSTYYSYVIVGVSAADVATQTSAAAYALTPSTTAPAAPTGLTATAASGYGIDLTWSPVPGATYDVYRTGDGQSRARIATAVTGTAYDDTGLQPGTAYQYDVMAVVNGVEGPSATPVTATTELPPAPAGLKAAAASETQIDLSWSAVAGASYNVYRSTAGAAPTAIATGLSGTSYADTGLQPSTTYTYDVSAVVRGVEGASSATASATTSGAPSGGGTGGGSGGGGGGGGSSGGGGGGGTTPPSVTSVSPASGPAGTEITITGSNFTGATGVYFNDVPGTSLDVHSGGDITVDAPAGLTGTVDITVHSQNGTSAIVSADEFTYTAGAVGVAASVAAAGGTLGTTDGTFTMTVPANDISGTAMLSLTESAAVPAGLPSGLAAASPVFTLAGAALTSPVTAVIQYQASALGGLMPQRLAVYAQSGSGGWTFVPTAVGSDGTVRVRVSGPETLVVLANTKTFSDIPAGYWARQDIDALLAAGVVSGYPGGTFQPNGVLTRAEFVKMLVLALGTKPGTGATTFTDVRAGDWFAPYVAAAVKAGLVRGLTATTFGADQTVSREQMAVLLARALNLSGTSQLSFRDAGEIDAYASAAVQAAVAAGYLSGFPDGTFRPQAPTTRAQAAKVLAAVLTRRAQAGSSQ